jgi:hypothetical protein
LKETTKKNGWLFNWKLEREIAEYRAAHPKTPAQEAVLA